jgi:HD superfamily phosphohydrolase
MESYPVRFRDPIHGFIHLSKSELKLVQSRAFRRLIYIKQLALTYLVYPGAMHTRFEHSLGVMELATRAFDTINKKSGELLSESLKQIEMTVEQARNLLRTTALLHDIGHLPFSHGGETVLPKGYDGEPVKHEQVSIALIRDEELSGLLKDQFYPEIVDQIVLLLGEGAIPPELLVLKKLISGQFDADRMDYLNRDSLHCGVGYGNFDYLRLLETLQAKEAKQGGLELCIERGGIHTLEAMMLARYWMFAQVYFHKTRRIYDIYLRRYLKAWDQGQYKDLLNVLMQDDVTVMNDIIKDADEGEGDRRKYAQRIRERKHHSVVYETSYQADASSRNLVIDIEKKLRQKYSEIDFIVDMDASSALHKFYVKGEEKIGEEFPIYDTVSGRYIRLSEESSIFEKIPKSFHVIRIYADIPKPQLKELRQNAAEIEQKERQVI